MQVVCVMLQMVPVASIDACRFVRAIVGPASCCHCTALCVAQRLVTDVCSQRSITKVRALKSDKVRCGPFKPQQACRKEHDPCIILRPCPCDAQIVWSEEPRICLLSVSSSD